MQDKMKSMKPKSRVWLIPGIFFLIACAANLYGCLSGNVTLERYVKGALMPLLALTGISFIAFQDADRRTVALLLAAQCLGWAGDSLLMGGGFAWFATGLGCFLVGHGFYIALFSRSLKGLDTKTWLLAGVVMALLLVGVVLAIGIRGVMLAPMAVYGAALLVIVFCGICGVCRKQSPSRATWLMVILGGFLFLVSDLMIAMRTFGVGDFPHRGFVIMLTYLIAQSLLCAAAASLATRDLPRQA